MMRDTKQTIGQRKQALRRFMLGTSFRISLIIAIFCMGLLYLLQTNSVATKGYTLSALQSQIDTLERENRSLEVQVAEHRSMDRIASRLNGRNYVSAGQLEHLTPVGTAVALR